MESHDHALVTHLEKRHGDRGRTHRGHYRLPAPSHAGMIEITPKSDFSDEEGLGCPTPNG
jgi:hypothetical protein